jgi:hypothetical protein
VGCSANGRIIIIIIRRRRSAVGIVTRLRSGQTGVRYFTSIKDLFPLQSAGRHWSPYNVLFKDSVNTGDKSGGW